MRKVKDWEQSWREAMASGSVIDIDIDLIQPDPDNPNVEELGTFNDVVRSMKEDGFTENIVVRPVEGGMFMLVSGEHRWKAARQVGLKKAPCVIKDFSDRDAKIRLVRMNALKGKLDPAKFTKLFQKLNKEMGMTPEEIKRQTGFGSRDAEFQKLIKSVEAGLPPSARDEFKKRAEKISSVEDLAAVVQALFAKHGGTLDANYVLFSFGGKTHLMVKAEKPNLDVLLKLADRVRDAGMKLDAILADAGALLLEGPFAAKPEEGAK